MTSLIRYMFEQHVLPHSKASESAKMSKRFVYIHKSYVFSYLVTILQILLQIKSFVSALLYLYLTIKNFRFCQIFPLLLQAFVAQHCTQIWLQMSSWRGYCHWVACNTISSYATELRLWSVSPGARVPSIYQYKGYSAPDDMHILGCVSQSHLDIESPEFQGEDVSRSTSLAISTRQSDNSQSCGTTDIRF